MNMQPYYRFRLLRTAVWCLTAVLLSFITACNEDEQNQKTTQTGKIPEVITYSPEYTEAGSATDAMIMGENFGTDPKNVIVKLGELTIPTKEVGNSVIKFTIPNSLDIGSYPLSVEINYMNTENKQQTMSHTFEVDFEVRGSTPVISELSPQTGTYAGGTVTIAGDHFGTDKNNVTINFDQAKLDIISITTNAIIFNLPENSELGTHSLEIEIKYGVNATQKIRRTYEYQVYKKEYVASSSVYAGTGAQGINNGPRLAAQFYAPRSLAYDAATQSLYVGEISNGIRIISNNEVSWYHSPQEGNPWAFGETCSVCISGNNLYYTVKEAHDRNCNILYMASRTDGIFGTATGHQTPKSPYTDMQDVTVNPVDGRIVMTRYSWDAFRMESYFYLLNDLDGTAIDISGTIPPLWVNNNARVLFSPDGKWLYVARGSDSKTVPSGDVVERPHAYIVRYPYNPETHTIGSKEEQELIAGSTTLNEIGFIDGAAGTSRLNGPRQMCFDSTGNILYFIDQHNHALRKVTNEEGIWTTSTFAGGNGSGTNNVTNAPVDDLKNIQFNSPVGLSLANDNTFYIAEDGGKVIRKIEIKIKEQ